jgi:hypothetical protein
LLPHRTPTWRTLAGATYKVVLTTAADPARKAAGTAIAEGTTDRDGAFTSPPLPADAAYAVVLSKDGFEFSEAPQRAAVQGQYKFAAKQLAQVGLLRVLLACHAVRMLGTCAHAPPAHLHGFTAARATHRHLCRCCAPPHTHTHTQQVTVAFALPAGTDPSGVFVALSGSGGFKRNARLATGATSITFAGLQPGTFYLKPLLREHSFEPQAAELRLQDGQQLQLRLAAVRTAWGVSGAVVSGERRARVAAMQQAARCGAPLQVLRGTCTCPLPPRTLCARRCPPSPRLQ